MAAGRLARWWFPRTPPERLAGVRILTGTWTLYYLGRRWRLLRLTTRGARRHFQAVGPARVLRRPLPPTAAMVPVAATYASSVAFIAGWRHRITAPFHAGLVLWTLAYRNSWSMVFHNDNLLVLHTIALAGSPAADAWSLDARRVGTPGPSRRYGWPLQLLRATTAATYFVAGMAKLRSPLGWRWATGESLRSQVLTDGLRKELLSTGASPVLPALLEQRALWRAMGLTSLAIEVGAPLALLSRRAGRLWGLAAWSMHVGIFVTMRITFRHQLSGIAFAPWFDVERLPAHGLRLAADRIR